MESKSPTATDVAVHVDPTCPFAWITRQWLADVAAHTALQVRLELMSLSVVNEGRELDGWYRDYNDMAWRPARVGAALLASAYSTRWPAFYVAFGQRRHVDGCRDDQANIGQTLADLSLPADLAAELTAAAEDPRWDDDLRRRTAAACRLCPDQAGTPILHIGGSGFFGPVLTSIPRGEAAVQLWQAVVTLAQTDGFSEIKGPRHDQLRTF